MSNVLSFRVSWPARNPQAACARWLCLLSVRRSSSSGEWEEAWPGGVGMHAAVLLWRNGDQIHKWRQSVLPGLAWHAAWT